MSKTPTNFYNQYNGKAIDDDSYAGVQCVDAFRVFCKWIGSSAYPTPNGWADGYWYGRSAHADVFDSVPVGQFKNGDWVIWAKFSKSHESSHIAMYYNGYEFGQNQSTSRAFTLKKTDFSDALGALRWKGWNTNNDNYKSGGGEVREKGNDLKQVNAQDTEASTRKIATSFHIYCKTDKKPQMVLKVSEFEGSKIYAVQIKVDENIQICTSFAPDTEWLCKMHSDYMLQHGYKEIACCNAGYFEMSGNVGKPVGAVLKDWEGKWSKWNNYECVPGKGNGYPTLCWDDGTMTLVDANADAFDLKKYHWCQGVGQSLVVDGKVNCNIGSENGRYSIPNNATAIGYNGDTKIMTLMANVKSSTGAGQLTTLQRAYVMQGLGCTLAVQLDGGGSTQLEWLESELSADDHATPENPANQTPTDPIEDTSDKDETIKKLTAENSNLKEQIGKLQYIINQVRAAIGND